jgi:hypothetical protein
LQFSGARLSSTAADGNGKASEASGFAFRVLRDTHAPFKLAHCQKGAFKMGAGLRISRKI